ncbi:hypothetical protein SAMN05444339_12411 [Loktanella atrilutea]|uniref:Uncharacterized protein n=1 Tax=Loktanella atrilutea TaxID=366533 RepID=A0A1M5FRL3_LOKAT|nr:hypothetical protein [Loktanella atrilutea]SHF94145.1 hypothetical protein SAMN05444339_12411 [Loktanella atrilutea]
MSKPLSLHAECFAAAGGMAADGMKKLLGTPALSLLETVVRETVQNSWDARLVESGVGYRIGLRELRSEEAAILRDEVLAKLPPSKESADPLLAYLSSKHPVVMEISDWRTRGLGGPSRANVLPKPGEHNDFVNFVRNMGARRDMAGGGGTYGYGKSSLYQLSRCATVLVDSVSLTPSARIVHRFIGCHLGDAHDSKRHGRLTGRHWWGVADADDADVVDPVTGRSAVRLRKALGLPDRGADATGTTLVVLDPDLEDRPIEAVVAEIQEALLWYLWPKMLIGADGQRAMAIEVELNGELLPLPAAEDFPPLDLFVEAYRTVKAGGPNLTRIASERPIQHLGLCSIRRGFKRPRQFLGDPADSIIPATSAHIALMRPVELVVKYIEGTHLPSDTVEWAGVFICDDDPVVEQAFADAEPPAHDDWIPDKMPKSWAKTFVRVALARLKYLAASYAYPASSSTSGASEQPPLAKAADLLGSCMPTIGGTGGGGGGSRGRGNGQGGGGRGGGPSWRVSEPRFVALQEGATGAEALFEIDVDNNTERAIRLTAIPAPVIDGVLAGPDEGDVVVTFICWEDQDGNQLTTSPELVATPDESGSFRARVIVPDVAAAGVRVAAAEQAPS